MDNDRLSRLIGRIYDCAVDPEQWTETLTHIRDTLDLAFVSMNYLEFGPTYPQTPPDMRTFITDWDMEWIAALGPLVPKIPHFDAMRGAALDQPVTQLSLIDEPDFRRTEFYREWVEPQGLRDTCNISVIKRDRQNAMLSATIRDSRALFSDEDVRLLGLLSPHLRRALMISDMVDEQRSWIQIYNALLDSVSSAVFLVETGARLRYHNAAAEQLLVAERCIRLRNGQLQPVSGQHADAFAAALDRACAQDDATLGSWGNGMALPGEDGAVAIAYVLPLGRSERRRALGPGLAAIFMTSNADARPPSMEVIAALSGLTLAEARVALAIASGKSTQTAANESGISIHTLRKHLANIYEKTGMRSQTALATFVNRLNPPM